MKRFVIHRPQGRSTVELRRNPYVNKAEAMAKGMERRTHTEYLGSFSVHLNPSSLDGVEVVRPGDASSGIRLRPGRMLDGRDFELAAADVAEVRAWLHEHGTWTELERRRAEQQRRDAEEHTRVKFELRAEVERALRVEIRAELEKQLAATRRHPLEEAVVAVELAAHAVREEAARLKAAGQRLASRRGKNTKPDTSAAGRLLGMTLRLRKTAFSQFEDACKSTGLMVRKAASGVDS